VIAVRVRAFACAVIAGGVLAAALAGATPALAGSVWWGLQSSSWPSRLAPGGEGKIVVSAQNRGDASIDGHIAPVVVRDVLPAGVEVLRNGKGEPEIESSAGEEPGFEANRGPLACSLSKPREAECRFGEQETDKTLLAYEQIEMRILVRVAAEPSANEENTVAVSGGGGSPSTLTRALSIGEEEARFGVENYELLPEEEGGAPTLQAGKHPFQMTSVLSLNTSELVSSVAEQLPAGFVKDVTIQLPPGLIGNPTPFPQCTDAQFSGQEPGTEHDECPADTAIGVVSATSEIPVLGGFSSFTVPLFNLTPLAGEPARFGFDIEGFLTTINISVRAGRDYGVTASVHDVTEGVGFIGSQVTIWGTPGDPKHAGSRGWACLKDEPSCALASESEPPPLLAMPTACTGPMRSTVQVDSWAERHPARPLAAPLFDEYEMGGLGGCNSLQFEPSIRVEPDVPDASTSTGLTADVHISQSGQLNAAALAESAVKDIAVALPEGVAVNPSGGDGLEACSEALVGFLGSEPGGFFLFTPRLPGSVTALQAGETEPLRPGVNFCADASKIGTVTIRTPLLPNPLDGSVYLATQNQNPFGGLIAMYLVAEDPVSGTLVKLAGEVTLDPVTGRLTGTFANNPELPFEDAELKFFGGERAPLATPAHCGAYETNATLTPWSGNPPVAVSSTFPITSGRDGGPCPGASLPFSPSLTGGTTNIDAGAFTPLSTTIGREDGQQDMASVTLHMPPGLSGLLAGVKLCPEAQANAGTCGPESLIGETTVSAGVGPDPVSVKGGKVYITESYHGAPFGLSIVNPVKAGPFDLEHDTSNPAQDPACDCLVVRARIEVDPHTATLTVTTNSEAEGYSIPHLIDGIPVQIRKVNVLVNRPNFTFNPTNCSPAKITGEIKSDEGASSPVEVPFEVANCATLAFAPKFAVSTQGKTSKANGASLSVKLSEAPGSLGKQANVAKVKVELPLQLPSRLTTLQKACTATQFATNPAGCPAASIIGHVLVHTPLLPVPLEGPAYFVSNGGEAFPNLIMVLQGYGVTVDLIGDTFISKTGVTSSTFKSVPDVPFQTFELTLPQGPHSALAANVNLCMQTLSMPTEFTGQNGAQLKQKTPIEVEGCSATLAFTSHQIKGRTLIVSVYAPTAGRLTVGGKGLTSVTKTAKRRETIAFELTQKRAGRLRTTVKATFTPSAGKDRRKQAKSLRL
jgi:hypothetical protein